MKSLYRSLFLMFSIILLVPLIQSESIAQSASSRMFNLEYTTIDQIPALNLQLKGRIHTTEMVLGLGQLIVIVDDKAPKPKDVDEVEIDCEHITKLKIEVREFDCNVAPQGGHCNPDCFPTEKTAGDKKFKFEYCCVPEDPADDEPYQIKMKTKVCKPDPKDKTKTIECVLPPSKNTRPKWTNFPKNWDDMDDDKKKEKIDDIVTKVWDAKKCDESGTSGSPTGECGGKCYKVVWRMCSYFVTVDDKKVKKWKIKIVTAYPVLKKPDPKEEDDKKLPETKEAEDR